MAIDLGFGGSVIEKFEKYFGRWATGALLMLFGLAGAALSMGAIWEWLVSPLLTFFQTPVWGQTVGSVIWVAFTIGAGISFGFWAIAAARHWVETRKLARLTSKAKQLVSDGEKTLRDARETQRKATDTLNEVKRTSTEADELNDQTAKIGEIMIGVARELSAKTPGQTESQRSRLEKLLDDMSKELNDRPGTKPRARKRSPANRP